MLGQEHVLVRLPRCPDVGKTPRLERQNLGLWSLVMPLTSEATMGRWLGFACLSFHICEMGFRWLTGDLGEFWGAFWAYSRGIL